MAKGKRSGIAKLKRLTEALEVDEAVELMRLAGNATRLKLLYILETLTEVNVSDLSDLLGVSVSAVSQHLAKLKVYGLVNSRRDAQTIYYQLADHDFIDALRREFFRAWAHRSRPASRRSAAAAVNRGPSKRLVSTSR